MQELNIWGEFDKLHTNFDNEKPIDDYIASMEKFNAIRFHRENHVFRIGHFGGRIIELDKKTQLPTGAIVHLLDNLEHTEWLDTPRVDNNELIQRESYRKFIYHVREPNLTGPVKMEDKYIYRPAGLPSVLMKFRSAQGNNFRYVNQLHELPTRMESLSIVNHNPLFRIKLFGRMQYFRRFQLILASVLNTCCQIAEEHKANKQQYIFLPWSEAIYDKALFLRNRTALTIQSVRKPESAHYIVMMHILNFLWKDATTSVFRALPEDVLSKINLVLKHNDKYIFYNLQDLVNLNVSQTTYLKCANHMNLLSILGRREEEKTIAEQAILDSIKSENKTTEEEIKEVVDTSTSIDTYPDADKVEVIATTVDDVYEQQTEDKIEKVIEEVANVSTVRSSTVAKIVKDVDLVEEVLPVTAEVTAVSPNEEVPISKVLVSKANATSIKSKSSDLTEEAKVYLDELDAEAETFIDSKSHMTPKEKQRMINISKKYKSLTLGGESLENIMLDDNDISLTVEPLDAKILGVVPDPSALKSSLSDFDKAYQKKTFKKHLVSTITAFQKNGVYLTDVKEEKIVSEMNNLTVYTCKYTDIDSKQSTIKFRIPTVDSEGRILIDGVKQVLKKQRITLPIVKINELEVSLASNQNKTRIMRNTNRAHSFGAYIENMLSSEKSTVEIVYGSNKVNLPLPYEYSVLADKITKITFYKGESYELWFDYNNRLNHFGGKEELLIKLEAIYGVYLGKTDKLYLFIDHQNKVHITLRNGSEYLDDHPESIFEVLKLSLKDDVAAPKPLSEWVSIKILDKQLPVMFVLAYRFGLRHMLDYIGLDYVVTERRTKTIVSENTRSVGPKSVPGMEELHDSIKDTEIDTDIIDKIFSDLVGQFNLTHLEPSWSFSEYPVDNKGNKYDKIPVNQFAGCVANGTTIYLATLENMPIVMKTWGIDKKYSLYEFYTLIIAHELSHIVWKKVLSESEREEALSLIPKDYTDEYLDSYDKTNEKYNEERYCQWQAHLVLNTEKILTPKPFKSDISMNAPDVDHVEISSDKRYQVKPGDIQIKFADRTLWINRYPLAKSLVVAGLEYFDLSAYEMSEFESPDVYFKLLQDKRLSTNYLKGINAFFDAFIDPMTYTTLKMMKEPTTVKDLLLRGAVLLSTLDHRPASSRENHRIRGYEQFNAILYNEMARQFATYRAKQGKANVFSINPDAVFLRIIQNASMVTSETTNPLQDMKEQAYLTYSGVGGRTADSFVLNDRKFADDDVGIISEAVPDNQKVGINAQLSANPGVINTMGVLEPPAFDELEPSNVFSSLTLMFPFSTNDDSKRISFLTGQSSHWVPTTSTEHSRVKTGYERVIAHRVGRDFAGISTEDGTVSNIDTKAKLIEVTYTNGDIDVFPYGENYVEYQGFHVTQEIESIVTMGQKLKKGDVITYNKGYFNLDPTTKQLDMTLGVQANVVLMEVDGTLEDSAEISQELSSKLSMKPTHTRMVTLTNTSVIWNSLTVGDQVVNTDALMVFEEDMAGTNMPTDDPAAMQMLSELNRKTPTAKYSGTIVKMEVFYGGEIADMHPSLQSIVKPLVDAKNREYRLANKTIQTEKYPPSGKIPTGSKYKGVMFDESVVCIQYYIQETVAHEQGDKLVCNLQLKATCSGILEKPIQTESGISVDMLFSASAMGNRIVMSGALMGMSARIMEKMEENVLDMYFNNKK